MLLHTMNNEEDNLIINNSLQTRNNLQILRLISIFPIVRNLHIAIASLLLRLSDFDPLLGGEVLTEFCECVLGETQTVEHGAVLDGV